MTDPTASRSAAVGDLLGGRYHLARLLAQGGMASVWQATDTVLQREVAVKVLHPHLAGDATFVARFRAEAVAVARLRHANVVAIYDTCSDQGHEAIVMELVRGRNLRTYLDEHGPLHPAEAVHIVAEAADGLAAAHRAGLVHRDVKPANILIRDDGQILVTDFGIAKVHAQATDFTQAGMMIGSVRYLAPEQVEGGPVDPRTDVYSLGIVAYEALTGRVPFQGPTDAATALARLREEPPRPRALRPAIPPALEAVVLRAMARHPAQRYASATELRAALLSAPVEDGTAAQPTGLAPRPQPLPPSPARAPAARPARVPASRRWLVPSLLVVLVATALGVTGVLFARTELGRELLDDSGPDNPSTSEAPPATSAPSGATVAGARDLDPLGDGVEHPAEVGRVLDGDPGTAWTTERYSTPSLGGVKPGVGLLIELVETVALDTVVVRSPTTGWSAEVHVADDAAAFDQGPTAAPADAQAGIQGDATFSLGGAPGRVVLVWITSLGGSGSDYQVAISAVEVSAP